MSFLVTFKSQTAMNDQENKQQRTKKAKAGKKSTKRPPQSAFFTACVQARGYAEAIATARRQFPHIKSAKFCGVVRADTEAV